MRHTPKLRFFTAIFLMFMSASAFALDNICNAPDCKVYKVTSSDGIKLNVYDWGKNNTKNQLFYSYMDFLIMD